MSACRWNGRGEPRVLPGRHGEDCPGDECAGCQPCELRHCPVCQRQHSDGACPECIAATRDDLAAIRLMCGALPTEVEHRGVNGEAMMLLGPSADPAAFSRRTVKLLHGGRCLHHQRAEECPDDLPPPLGPTCRECDHDVCREIRAFVAGRYRCPEKVAWIEDARDEMHPLYVLGTWEELYRQQFRQRSDLKVTIDRAGDYLDRNLHRAAETGDVPFEDFAADVRRCRAHLEEILHDGEQVETGAPCMTCSVPLRLHRGDTEERDYWSCPKCRERSTVAQYLFAVQNEYRRNASALTARDMAKEYDVPEGSVRAWASEKVGKVRKRGKDSNGRQLYDVADVLATRDRAKSA